MLRDYGISWVSTIIHLKSNVRMSIMASNGKGFLIAEFHFRKSVCCFPKSYTNVLYTAESTVSPRYNDNICSQRYCHHNEFAVIKNICFGYLLEITNITNISFLNKLNK